MKTYAEYQQMIEMSLSAQLASLGHIPEILFESMDYSLSAGGKRLRPVLLLAACDTLGGDLTNALPFACALEMIHTYSLIHDDLPCMDDDDFRRGKPTNHKVFGEALAVLAGDGLLTHAFARITMAKLPAEGVVAAVRTLADCAGEDGMVGGQVLDMAAEERQCTEEEVRAIQSRKTGALIRAACLMGVIAAGGDEAQMTAARTYADCLGLAFQIRDDILDVVGDAALLGKATGTDAHKNTFVRLYGIERCKEMVAEQTRSAIEALAPYGASADFLISLAQSLVDREM